MCGAGVALAASAKFLCSTPPMPTSQTRDLISRGNAVSSNPRQSVKSNLGLTRKSVAFNRGVNGRLQQRHAVAEWTARVACRLLWSMTSDAASLQAAGVFLPQHMETQTFEMRSHAMSIRYSSTHESTFGDLFMGGSNRSGLLTDGSIIDAEDFTDPTLTSVMPAANQTHHLLEASVRLRTLSFWPARSLIPSMNASNAAASFAGSYFHGIYKEGVLLLELWTRLRNFHRVQAKRLGARILTG